MPAGPSKPSTPVQAAAEAPASTLSESQKAKNWWSGESEAFARVMDAMEKGTAELKQMPSGYYDDYGSPITQLAITAGGHPGYDTLFLTPTSQENVYQFSTYNQKAGGNIHGVIAANPETGQYLPVQDYTKQIQYTPGSPGGWARNVIGDVGDMLKSMGPLPMIVGNAILPGAGSALAAVLALDEGNKTGAVLNALSAGSNLSANAAANALAAEVSGNADLANQYSSGVQGALAQNAGAIKTASDTAQLANAIDKGNLAGALNAAGNLTGLSGAPEVKTGMAVAGLAKALTSGDTAGAISLAGQLTNSPDAVIAGKALKIANALEKGNMAVVGSALFDLGKSADKYLQAANSSTSAFEKEINSALDDKTSMSKEVAAATQQLVDAFSAKSDFDVRAEVQLAEFDPKNLELISQAQKVYTDTGDWNAASALMNKAIENEIALGDKGDLKPNGDGTFTSKTTGAIMARNNDGTWDTYDPTSKSETGAGTYLQQKDAETTDESEFNDLFKQVFNREPSAAEKSRLLTESPEADILKQLEDANKGFGTGEFETLEDYLKYDGNYQDYLYDQMSPTEKSNYEAQQWSKQSDAKSQEHGFPDYATEKLYRGDVEAYNRDVAQKAMLESMDPKELEYLNYRNQLEGESGFESLADFKKYDGDYQAYLYDQMTPWEKEQYALDEWTKEHPEAGIKTPTGDGSSGGGSSDFESLPITIKDTNRIDVIGGGGGEGGGGVGEEEEEEPKCAAGWAWNGSMCVAEDDNPDKTTSCPEGYVLDLNTQSCVKIGTTDGGGGGGGGGTKPPTPQPVKDQPVKTETPPPTKDTSQNNFNLLSLLALLDGGSQQNPTPPQLADIKYYYDFGDPFNPNRGKKDQPELFEFYDGGEVNSFSVDDLIEMLKKD